MIGNKQARAKGTQGKMVFVTNLRFQVNEQELMDYFKSAGFDPVRSRLLYDNEGNSKGSGFVEMSSEEKATEAVAKLHNDMF
jgi:RNA recognition motif-containing protein